jgi:hypothetical protein
VEEDKGYTIRRASELFVCFVCVIRALTFVFVGALKEQTRGQFRKTRE